MLVERADEERGCGLRAAAEAAQLALGGVGACATPGGAYAGDGEQNEARVVERAGERVHENVENLVGERGARGQCVRRGARGPSGGVVCRERRVVRP